MGEKFTAYGKARYVLMLAAIALFAAFALTAGTGQALAVTVPDEGVDIKGATGNLGMTYYRGAPDSNYLFFQGVKGKKVSSVKSSNAKVVSAKAAKGGKFLQIQMKKGGKAKITYKYGKKTYKFTITVHEYICPVKSLKVGSREFAKWYKNVSGIGAGKRPSGKVSVKPVAGYKLKTIQLLTFANGDIKEKKIKNNSTIKKGQGNELVVYFTNKKTGDEQRISLYLGD